MNIKLEDFLAAHAQIKPHIHKTPLLRSRRLSELLGCELLIKAEFLQKTGAFKARGVMNYLITSGAQASTYTTFSSGNHGQALSWGAARMGRSSTIFMPRDASPAKVAAVEGYGGEVRFAGLSSLERRQACLEYARQTGARVVPPFDDPWIIAGQGTVLLEVLEEAAMFDAALVPVGGGGLLAGCAFVLNTLRPKIAIYACEPELADDLRQSLVAGRRLQIPYPETIADGTRNLMVGELNWEIIAARVSEGLTCDEQTIRRAMGLYASITKQVVEPSGALSLACLLANRERFAGKKVLLVASGGNIALEDYAGLVGGDA